MSQKHLTAEEVHLFTKLVSSPSFCKTVGDDRLFENLGQMCQDRGIEEVSRQVKTLIEPRCAAVFGSQSVDTSQPPLPASTPSYPSEHSQISQADNVNPGLLFDSLSDEALLSESSFGQDSKSSGASLSSRSSGVDNSKVDDKGDFDLLDSDSWYRK